MDFLETDFHKIRNPKRTVQLKNSYNLQVGINLYKYKKFPSKAWRLIQEGFTGDTLNRVKKGEHTANISKQLLDLIKHQISLIDQDDIDLLINKFNSEIDIAIIKNKNDASAAISFALDGINRVLKEDFIFQFVERLQEPLEKNQTTNVDSIYQIEEELSEILMAPFEDNVSSIINHKLLETDDSPESDIDQIFEINELKNKLESYFSGFNSGDLFIEISELFNNKSLLENQEFYLYFGDITLNGSTFPLFYIPIEVSKGNDSFELIFDSLVYVHKKAVQYVVQTYNAQQDRRGNLSTFIDRIVHLSDDRSHFVGLVDAALKDLITYFGLSPYIDINNPERQTAKGPGIQISNSCYLAIFDKSDESLINDYEEILTRLGAGDDMLAGAFSVLVDDFITNNPTSVVSIVEGEWDAMGVEERLVYESPVPLNEEQKLILSSLGKSNCKYVSVQGPPGTGKSHTITAIVCDAVLKNQSILVLSDKKEALDVVEDKITQTLNKVRSDNSFQNPILRLGQAGNTYSKILSNTSMTAIKNHYKVTRNEFDNIENNIGISVSNLKDSISNTIHAYDRIKLSNIAEVEILRKYFDDADVFAIDSEVDAETFGIVKSVRDALILLEQNLNDPTKRYDNVFKHFYPTAQSAEAFLHFISLIEIARSLEGEQPTGALAIKQFQNFSATNLRAVEIFIQECASLKSRIFGHLFKGRKLRALDVELHDRAPNGFEQPHKNLEALKALVAFCRDADSRSKTSEIETGFTASGVNVERISSLLSLPFELPSPTEAQEIIDAIRLIQTFLRDEPELAEDFGISLDGFWSFRSNDLLHIEQEEFDKFERYISLRTEIEDQFDEVPEQSYLDTSARIESLVTAKMTHKIDERVVDFYENFKNDAKSLAATISQKKRFDRDSFEKLRQSFPCILAGIRDFAEFIPLQSGIFDIVIIDEASQVSIAQALPALLRGKKVIVLGDKKQFSNVKSTQARTETNRQHLNRLRDVFIKEISTETIKLERLEKFNIKTSILDFSDRISNFDIMLKKHFRGYREIISYSSKFFYENSLQAIKIRSKPIADVIKFQLIEHDGLIEQIPNTNRLEIEAVVAEVERLAVAEPQSSIAIITPHTNQQKLLMEAFSKHKDLEGFQKNQRLKIMTFDTCQGEERDIVLYSMVASPTSDKLWGVFIKDLKSQDLEEGGQIKAQRLNVGFSRAKERMHFFISKPISEFTGSIGEALAHYERALEEAAKLPEAGSTDPRSPMEAKVLQWIQETLFFKERSSQIELHTQFPLGEYIKQLDHRYEHPNYVVDFLVIYNDDEGKLQKCIIEYDGFEFHFDQREMINEFNYASYHNEDHVYREKVLESYGYKFIRLNRFNLGDDPIATLNERLERVLKKKDQKQAEVIFAVQQQVSGLADKTMKECPQCKGVKPISEFRDAKLASGVGRVCVSCKASKVDVRPQVSPKPSPVYSDQKCPRCNSRMVLRTRRSDGRGFYGCSRFPRCKGTRPS